jgi:glyoxylase-like metal-dependent hydrolase (beta-lactamase superfamily II)
MGDYLASLRKLLARDDRVYWPTHGAPIRDPKPFVEALIAHRLEREAQIADALANGVTCIPDIVRALYADVDPRLHAAASVSVLAHLIKLVREGRATCDGEPTLAAEYRPG